MVETGFWRRSFFSDHSYHIVISDNDCLSFRCTMSFKNRVYLSVTFLFRTLLCFPFRTLRTFVYDVRTADTLNSLQCLLFSSLKLQLNVLPLSCLFRNLSNLSLQRHTKRITDVSNIYDCCWETDFFFFMYITWLTSVLDSAALLEVWNETFFFKCVRIIFPPSVYIYFLFFKTFQYLQIGLMLQNTNVIDMNYHNHNECRANKKIYIFLFSKHFSIFRYVLFRKRLIL